MKRAPLLEELLKYKKEENLILSMPGNKSGKAFLRDDLGKRFKSYLGDLDITEVGNLDNLHSPEGVIKEAQELLAKTYKVKKAYFLVNGSTSGNLASIFAAFNEGDEVLVERNCHKSIYNALILRKLKVIYIEAVFDEDLGVFLPPDFNNIKKALKIAKKPKGIILTSPNYFGISYDYTETIITLKSMNLKVIIDSAHGAHFNANKRLPKSLYSLGDYVVISAHKTLPSLTQGAYLLVNDEHSNIDFYVKAFMTTSPSYLIMASLDYSRYYLDNYGEKDYDDLINRANIWKEKINSLNKVKIISDINLKKLYEIDKTRYVLVLEKGYSGHKLLDYLLKYKIQSEMSFSKGVVLILSPSNTDLDFEKVYLAIRNLDLENLRVEDKSLNYKLETPKKVLEAYEVFDLDYKTIKIKDALNMVAKENIVPYPPGIPIVCQGEIITKDVIEITLDYLCNNLTVLGAEGGYVKVIKKY